MAILGNNQAKISNPDLYQLTLDQFSDDIAMQLVAAARRDVVRGGSGNFTDNEIQFLDWRVWDEKGMGSFFPGNLEFGDTWLDWMIWPSTDPAGNSITNLPGVSGAVPLFASDSIVYTYMSPEDLNSTQFLHFVRVGVDIALSDRSDGAQAYGKWPHDFGFDVNGPLTSIVPDTVEVSPNGKFKMMYDGRIIEIIEVE